MTGRCANQLVSIVVMPPLQHFHLFVYVAVPLNELRPFINTHCFNVTIHSLDEIIAVAVAIVFIDGKAFWFFANDLRKEDRELDVLGDNEFRIIAGSAGEACHKVKCCAHDDFLAAAMSDICRVSHDTNEFSRSLQNTAGCGVFNHKKKGGFNDRQRALTILDCENDLIEREYQEDFGISLSLAAFGQ
jgi:hypothetical protein